MLAERRRSSEGRLATPFLLKLGLRARELGLPGERPLPRSPEAALELLSHAALLTSR